MGEQTRGRGYSNNMIIAVKQKLKEGRWFGLSAEVEHLCDEYDRLQARVEKLEGLLQEWIKSEWMVSHDWGGDRDSLLHRTYLLVDPEYDGSYAATEQGDSDD